MRSQKIGTCAFLTILITLTPLATLKFSPSKIIWNSYVLAQDANALRAAYQQVINTYEEQLAKARKEGNRQDEVRILNNAGYAFIYFEQHQKAIALLQEAWTIAREIKDPTLSQIVRNLATAYSKLGDDNGIKFLEHQLEIAQQKGDRETEEIILDNLATAYAFTGNIQKKIETYEKHLAMVRQLNKRDKEASTLMNLAILYGGISEPQKAVELWQQYLAVVRELGDKNSEYNGLFSIGIIYQYQLNNDQKAIESYEQALQFAKAIANPFNEMITLRQLAFVYGSMNNAERAIALLEQVRSLAQQTNNRIYEGMVLGDLGRVYFLKGDYTKALELQRQTLAIAQADKIEVSQMYALANLGETLFRVGQLAEAENSLLEALTISEKVRQKIESYNLPTSQTRDDQNLNLYNWLTYTYRTLQQVLVAQNKIDTALELAEKSRARAFVHLLATRLAVDAQSQPKIDPPNLARIKQIAKEQNSTLVEYTVVYNDNNSLSQLVLNQEFSYETALLIWVIEPTGEVAFRRVDLKAVRGQDKKSLEQIIRDTRQSFGVGGRGIAIAARVDSTPNYSGLQQLYKILISPIADLLPTDPNQRVTFIAQDALFMVPFAALQDSAGKYLIEKHTIITAPSIQVLDLTRQAKQRLQTSTNKRSLVVGNPTMPSIRPKVNAPPEQLPSLPGSEKEANAIATLLSTQAITGNQATKSNIVQQMPNARIIHLATHGLLDDMYGFQSSLALAPSGKDDGLLTVREIINLKLNAELAILSACDTGRGRISGDGVIGLSRAFIGAGVSSVIVSLWSVPDSPTAFLMTEFYQNLSKNIDKAQALRQAMLTTMKQNPNPRDWAAFTLIGEAK
ncbi:CHAT domain-containing tetratricopeptide repeat protein [Planktothrix sp. FACHB-1355]|nr:CHAT domain-containing tetratricopeptide repeat protein [Planktothrix sp. FACHB-1355]